MIVQMWIIVNAGNLVPRGSYFYFLYFFFECLIFFHNKEDLKIAPELRQLDF